ncbi:substrate-binding and VWA domain-containing protein [Actinomadura sp. ATCC 31491]|uniref:Substrate-binding and VWA domain-containing protein n=1 Tax=Actinomadura luzonensis TaxID=2805427 RepID=A0ABT0FKB4_9ACTN|nr:substrate-binding domain-containing protein [Actinomadura luzonensis]MCK2212505.1 substrate-binding and VWA domain-containing protein [Actinomadura luzonensis]
MGRHRTDELDGGYRAGDPPSRRRARTSRGRVLVPLAGAVALAVLLGVAAFVIFNREHDCSSGKLALRVVATPDIQPALSKIAGNYNKAMHSVDSKCVDVTVVKEAAARTANALAAGKASADLWVADSSLLLESMRAADAAGALPRPDGSVALSPVVLATAKTSAAKLEGTLKPSWTAMVEAANVANVDGPGRKVRVLALDPQKNSAGLAALLAAAGAAKAAKQDKALVGALKELSGQLASDPAALLASLTVKSGSRVPVGVASEQAVYAHNARKPESPVVALYPQEGTLSLDYPLTVLTKDPATLKAVADFKKDLAGGAAEKVLRDAGFRSADGKAGDGLSKEKGFTPEAPRALEPPDAATVARMVQTWSRLNLGTRLLTLLDVSGTMALPVPGTGMTRMQAINKIATEGLGLFPADSELGLWTFSTHLDGRGKDWKELVSVGPVSEPINGTLRKDILVRTFAQIQAKATGDTGLNDTVKAAYTQLSKTYKEDKINTLLILTDGAGNDDPDGGLSNAGLLQYLRSAYNPKRPISILLIAFGPEAEKGKQQMDAVAKATGGEAYIAKDVLQVRDFFLQGMERRLCTPNCDG